MAITDKQKRLNEAINKINKQFGEGTVTKASEAGDKLVKRIVKTPSIEFNNMLYGGLGGIVELFGPESSGKTSMAIETLAENQARDPDFVGGWLETEGSITKEILQSHGVDLSRLIYWDQQDVENAENALDVIRSLVSSGAVDMIIVNSVAGLAPKVETEDNLEKQNIALVARLLSKFFRVITGIADKNKVTMVFINQVRDKVGVMFGCLHADTLVNFTDGRSIPIRKVVENKIKGKVWSYNETSKIFEEKEIIDWHYNGDVNTNKDYLHIEAQGFGGQSTRFGITVTQDHIVLTNNGWKKAKDITLNDMLVTKYESIINESLENFLWGAFIGDSTISIRSKSTACLKLQDNENPDYLQWKLSKLPKEFNMHKIAERYESNYISELAIVKQQIEQRDPMIMLNEHYSPLGLAIWYMDDGNYDTNGGHARASISIKRFKKTKKLEEIWNKLVSMGFDCSCNLNNGLITFTKLGTEKLFDVIHEYIPDCMQYKLGDNYKGKYKDFTLSYHKEVKEYYTPVTMIREASDKQIKQKGKYDLSIEGNHNYLVGGKINGVVVHNSPETTGGGRALAFYSSIRVRMNNLKIDKSDPIGDTEGVKISCIVRKNRFARNHNPYTKCIYYARYDSGIDNIVALPILLQEAGIVRQAGAWWYYEDENGQPLTVNGTECKFKSKNVFLDELRNNEILREELINKLETKDIKAESVSEEELAEITKEEEAIKSEMADFVEEYGTDEN